MTGLRISERNFAQSSLGGLESTSSKLAALNAQFASGRQITKPSDNPGGTISALEIRSELKRMTQYSANADDSLGWMTSADGAYSSAVKQLQAVRNWVLQASNTGTADATSQQALSDQVNEARNSLLALANTQYLGRPIFGGATAGTAAFTATGSGASTVVTYAGDTNAVTRTVGESTTVQVNQLGTDVFGADGSNVFDLMNTIMTDITSNPTALTGDLSSLDSAIGNISNQQALEGATYARVQQVQTAAASTQTQLKSQLSDIQDIDVASMAVQVSSANVAYQAALQTTANIRQVSLLDFLK
jgi:flagellar hook-associated protein 3 FlgL